MVSTLPFILFCGDPHGQFDHIHLAANRHQPDAIVLLGDMDLSAPLSEVMYPVLDQDIPVLWIPGNHDTDSDSSYDFLFRCEPHPKLICLHEQTHTITSRHNPAAQSLVIAGLGGVFRTKIWDPAITAVDNSDPQRGTRAYILETGGKGNRWRGGLPLRHRSTIFRDQVLALSQTRADILVTHEAPHHHKNGFFVLHELARAMQVQYTFHGHHHETADYGAHDRIHARGVGIRSIVDLQGRAIADNGRLL